MKLSIKHIILIVFFILSCEGPIFEIPPEPDTTAPLIEITNPADQGVLSDTVLVTMYASDNDEVNIVQLYINDSLVLDSAKSPYQYNWNTNNYEEDEYHNLLARAVDFAGNDNQTSPIRVMVDNNDNIKPSGSLLYPFSGQILSGIISIIADASDNDSLASVIFYINGDSVGVSTSAPHIYDWNTNLEVPDTYRGQPKNWEKSAYCSLKHAKESFADLIKNTKSNFILVSYNNKGIIPIPEMEEILNKYGKLYKIPVEHNVYNKLIGIAAKKRQKQKKKIEEFLWLLDCRKKLVKK